MINCPFSVFPAFKTGCICWSHSVISDFSIYLSRFRKRPFPADFSGYGNSRPSFEA